MRIRVKKFKELSVNELYDLLRLRTEIFVLEQKCVYIDQDYNDQESIHILGYEKKKLVAYARVVPPDTIFKTVSIGRVVVNKKFRGRAFGYEIMEKAIETAVKKYKPEVISISAQKHLEGFYGNLGFKSVGKVYLDDNIPHIKMLLKFKK
ncbi:MAG: GNAT family N-acetyltransferase [Bacteroidia bacterium]